MNDRRTWCAIPLTSREVGVGIETMSGCYGKQSEGGNSKQETSVARSEHFHKRPQNQE